MRSPAAAFAWEFRQRHRWGLIGIGVYVLLLAGVKLVVVRRGLPINFDSAESFAFAVAVIWPAVLAPALLAWTQALMWMPYPLPGLRVIAAVLCLGTIDSIVLLALRFQASERVMLAIAVPQLPLSYAAARYAVARARR